MTTANEKTRIDETIKIFQRVLNGKEKPDECQASALVPIFRERSREKLGNAHGSKAARACYKDRQKNAENKHTYIDEC